MKHVQTASSIVTGLSVACLVFPAAAGTLALEELQSHVISGQHPVFGGQISSGERFGRACTGIGDLDGDGIPDIAVGSRSDQDGGTDAGAVYVVFMNRDLTPRAAAKLGPGSGGIPADAAVAGDMFGYGVAGIGDLDGDGIPDLAITSPGAEPAGAPMAANRGALFVCLMNRDGSARTINRIDNQDGLPLAIGDSFGQSCAHLDDLDGDGLTEVGIGATGTDDGAFNAGALYVISLLPDATMLRFTRIGGVTAPRLLSLDDTDNFGGRGIAHLGDLDADGTAEIAVGCYRDDDGGLDRGAVWILSLRAGADGAFALERAAKISSNSGGLQAPLADDDLFGMTVAPLGDIDRDGTPDLASGNNKDDIGATDMGALFLLGLDPSGAVVNERVVAQGTGFPGLSLIAGERFGRALANLGDIRGDGSVVLGVGAGAGVNGGRLWLVAVGAVRTADVDRDGTVDGADLGALLSGWGEPGDGDLDWNGTTNGADLGALLSAW